MATILSKPGSEATSGERSVFYRIEHVFAGEDDPIIYFEPNIGDLRPDFLILSPSFGIIIIEVKDYSERNLLEVCKTGYWQSLQDLEKKSIQNPFDQIYKYWRAVKDRINHCKFPATLKIPIIRIVAFTNISKESTVANAIRNNAPKRVNLCFKECTGRNKLFEVFLTDLLAPEFTMTHDQFLALRANLIPTCRLPALEQTDLMKFFTQEDKVKLLDAEQEKLARKLGEGHRLMFGVAGSGKTILLIARARYLAIRHPDWKILVLCYNRLLKDLIFHLLNPQDYEADITITTFHAWARNYIHSANGTFSKLYEEAEKEAQKSNKMHEFFQEFVPRLLIDMIKAQGDDKVQYNAILIDEAQDFEQEWFKSVMEVLNPETNMLLITCDGLQGIYATKRFRWSDVGIEARGRVRRFEKSYRTPIEIGVIAQKILPTSIKTMIGKFDEFLTTKEFVGNHGSVEILLSKSRKEEYQELATKLKRLTQQPQKILVLFKRNMAKIGYDHPLFTQLKKQEVDWSDLSDYNYQTPGVLVGTLHGTKGLEFDTIIIPELDTYKTDSDRQLLYVGITRSKKKLILSAKESKEPNGTADILQTIQSVNNKGMGPNGN